MIFVRARAAYKVELPVPSNPVRSQAQTDSARLQFLRTTLTSDCLLPFRLFVPFFGSLALQNLRSHRTVQDHSIT